MSQQIKDTQSRPWNIVIDVVTVGLVRKTLGVNLLEILSPTPSFAEKLSDPIFLCDVLYLLCQEQCEAADPPVSDVEFGHSMSIDAIEAGWEAVLEGVLNFSRKGLRPAMRKVIDKSRSLTQAMDQQLQTVVASPEFDQMLETEMAKILQPPQQPPPPAAEQKTVEDGPTAASGAASSSPA